MLQIWITGLFIVQAICLSIASVLSFFVVKNYITLVIAFIGICYSVANVLTFVVLPLLTK